MIFPESIKTVISKINMDYITLNAVLSHFSTQDNYSYDNIKVLVISSRLLHRLLFTSTTVFSSNNSRKLNNFVFQSAIISVETKNLDSGIHEM